MNPPKLDIEAQTTSVHNVTQQSDFDLINDLLTFEPLGLDISPHCVILHIQGFELVIINLHSKQTNRCPPCIRQLLRCPEEPQ